MSKRFRTVSVKTTYDTLLADAKGEVEMLAEEMNDWKDNLEANEGLSATSKHDEVAGVAEALESAVSDLDSIDEDDVAKIVGNAEVTIRESEPYGMKPTPRWMRLAAAQERLNVLIERLDEIANDEKTDEDAKTDAEELRDEIQNVVDELDNVSFPGMF